MDLVFVGCGLHLVFQGMWMWIWFFSWMWISFGFSMDTPGFGFHSFGCGFVLVFQKIWVNSFFRWMLLDMV